MKKNRFLNKKNILTGLVLICLTILLFLCRLYYFSDREPPEISYPEGKRVLTAEDFTQIEAWDFQCLLKDVTAYDQHDGDATDRVVVKACRISEDLVYAVVTYMVMDSSCNYSYSKRIVYFDEEVYDPEPVNPTLTLNTDEIVTSLGVVPDIEDYIEELSDDVDPYDTLLENIQYEGSVNINAAGEYEMAVYVYDSGGNASEKYSFTLVVE